MLSFEFFWHTVGSLSEEERSWIEDKFEAALALCVQRWLDTVLTNLDELEVSVVSDSVLADLHGEFCGDPSPTDVITFPHGEILVSLSMAESKAHEFSKDTKGELLLYLIHGLLHLVGFDDLEESAREEMHRVQEDVWREIVA